MKTKSLHDDDITVDYTVNRSDLDREDDDVDIFNIIQKVQDTFVGTKSSGEKTFAILYTNRNNIGMIRRVELRTCIHTMYRIITWKIVRWFVDTSCVAMSVGTIFL